MWQVVTILDTAALKRKRDILNDFLEQAQGLRFSVKVNSLGDRDVHTECSGACPQAQHLI